jgi:hypothetical protein
MVLRNKSDMSFLGAELRSDLPEYPGRAALVADTGRKRIVLDASEAESRFELYSATRREQEQLKQADYHLQLAPDFVPAD